jgi:hypothetical protein
MFLRFGHHVKERFVVKFLVKNCLIIGVAALALLLGEVARATAF